MRNGVVWGEVRAGGLVRSWSWERSPGWWSAAGVFVARARRAAVRPPGLVSGGVGLTAALVGGDCEHGETGEVQRGGEQREIGGQVALAAHPRAPAAVAAARQVRDLALRSSAGWRRSRPSRWGLTVAHGRASCCSWRHRIVRSSLALVHRSASGQPAHAAANFASCRSPNCLSGVVFPAGQVTVASSRSIVNAPLEKHPARRDRRPHLAVDLAASLFERVARPCRRPSRRRPLAAARRAHAEHRRAGPAQPGARPPPARLAGAARSSASSSPAAAASPTCAPVRRAVATISSRSGSTGTWPL